MNLVVGATGQMGSKVCHLLANKGKPVRTLVRSTSDPARVDELKACGAEIAYGNLCDYDSLKTACKRVQAVISTGSSMPVAYNPEENNIQKVDLEGLTHLIAAAKAEGVTRFIYTSFSGQINLDFPLRNAKRAVKRRLKESGLTYTILRPSYFMETWLGPGVGFDYPNASVQIYGKGENPISWISAQNVAEFAVESLDNPAAQNATLELGGPEALSPLQAVQIFEEVSEKPFEIQHLTREDLQAQQNEATDPMQQSFSGLLLGYTNGDAIDMQEMLSAFPIQLISVADYARRALAAS